MTRRELAYSCLDLIKAASDDSFVTVEHALFLASKIRAMILKQRYSDIKKEIPLSNYQTICLELEETPAIAGNSCAGSYLKSKQKVPTTMPIGNSQIHSIDYYQGDITYISRERMRYVGNNPWLLNTIYASLGPDQHIYLKSGNPQYRHLEKVLMTGIFEDIDSAAELACDNDETQCDPLDMQFPLEEGLVSLVIEMVVKYLSGMAYKPKDSQNNADDDLSDLMYFIKKNMKTGFQKMVENYE